MSSLILSSSRHLILPSSPLSSVMNFRQVWPTVRGAAPPATDEARVQLVDELQDAKTEFYKVSNRSGVVVVAAQ